MRRFDDPPFSRRRAGWLANSEFAFALVSWLAKALCTSSTRSNRTLFQALRWRTSTPKAAPSSDAARDHQKTKYEVCGSTARAALYLKIDAKTRYIIVSLDKPGQLSV